jgi:hypothetical protein
MFRVLAHPHLGSGLSQGSSQDAFGSEDTEQGNSYPASDDTFGSEDTVEEWQLASSVFTPVAPVPGLATPPDDPPTERAFTCDICQKRFHEFAHLNRHCAYRSAMASRLAHGARQCTPTIAAPSSQTLKVTGRPGWTQKRRRFVRAKRRWIAARSAYSSPSCHPARVER